MVKGKIPKHIAIIPDGNRRWARNKGLAESFGHYKSGDYDNVEQLFRGAQKLGVQYMSIWGFSTENWKRNKKEIDSVFDVILKGVERFRKDGEKNKIRFRHIGRKGRLPPELKEALEKLEEETREYDDFNVQLCLDYGGRDEIVRAVNKVLKDSKGKVSEDSFSGYLDSYGIPDLDLVIRTSGEKRTSGFMPWQGAYAEWCFSKKYFPDFTPGDLRTAIKEFGERDVRRGS